jgi:hypothetical protein
VQVQFSNGKILSAQAISDIVKTSAADPIQRQAAAGTPAADFGGGRGSSAAMGAAANGINRFVYGVPPAGNPAASQDIKKPFISVYAPVVASSPETSTVRNEGGVAVIYLPASQAGAYPDPYAGTEFADPNGK